MKGNRVENKERDRDSRFESHVYISATDNFTIIAFIYIFIQKI